MCNTEILKLKNCIIDVVNKTSVAISGLCSFVSKVNSWLVQNLSNLILNVLTLFTLITEAGKLFRISAILTEVLFSDGSCILS